MRKHGYLKWMSEATESEWCNDSALEAELDDALRYGAVGCTTNPPLSFQALETSGELREEARRVVTAPVGSNERAVELIGVVVRSIAERLLPLYESSGGAAGRVRAQVRPEAAMDADEMVRTGIEFASWAPNVVVKIPGTDAGMVALEELAARGIATNPTVCASVPQMIEAAAAYDRGAVRAENAGIERAYSTSAIVMGRLQDYLASLDKERGLGLGPDVLGEATLAVAKRSCAVLEASGTSQRVMPAAFRSARQVIGLSGANVVMTIHPKIQDELIALDRDHGIERRPMIGEPADEKMLKRVLDALPEFRAAYEPDGLKRTEFDSFGGVTMTLASFHETGWQKLTEFEP